MNAAELAQRMLDLRVQRAHIDEELAGLLAEWREQHGGQTRGPRVPGPPRQVKPLDLAKRLQREDIEHRRIAGESLESIAAFYGLSRQRIEQLQPRWLGRLITRRNAARRRLRAIVDSEPPAFHRCRICGAMFASVSRRTFCSEEHYHVWQLLRSSLSSHHEQHRHHVALSLQRTNARPSSRAWAEQMLGDSPPPPNRRFMIEGSETLKWAATAYHGDWPIFDELDSPVRAWVIARYPRVEEVTP